MLGNGCPLELDEEGHELLPHGMDDFPCLGYDEILGALPGEDVAWHWHNDFEVICVLEGSMRVQVPGRSLVVGAGSGVFVNVAAMHHVAGEPRAHIRSLVFSPELVAGTVASAFARLCVTPFLEHRDVDLVVLDGSDPWGATQVARIARAAADIEDEHDAYELDVRDEMTRLCHDVAAARIRSDGTSGSRGAVDARERDAERLRAMCDYVHARAAERISVGDIAHAASVGEREGLRVFRRMMGTTPSKYLLYVRLELAASRLAHSGEPVAQVAQAVGIESPSNFARLFKGYYQVSPAEYRRQTQARTR